MAILAQLPFRWQMALGQLLGKLSYLLLTKRRHIAQTNIALCFPELTSEQQQTLVKQHFVSNGVSMIEVGMEWFKPYRSLKHLFEVRGEQHWQAVIAQGKGALVLGLHFNTLEIANVEMNRRFNLSVSYRSHKNPVFDYFQYRGRHKHNPNSATIDRFDLRAMVKSMQSGQFLWYAPDQDYGHKRSVFVPFFGILAATLSATPRLARMAKVPVVGLSYRRKPNLRGYIIEFFPVLESVPSGNDEADLLAINQYIEARIRDNPSEYLWVHRRFKTRPEGQASLY